MSESESGLSFAEWKAGGICPNGTESGISESSGRRSSRFGSGLGFLGALGVFAMVSETPRIVAETHGRWALPDRFNRKCYFSLSREAMGEQ